MRLRYNIVVVSLLALLAGAETSHAAPPRVVASLLPIHALVSLVMGDLGSPQLLVPAGATPHSFALRPSDARALSEADLVVWVGPAMEAFLARPLAALSGAGKVITLMDRKEIALLPARRAGRTARETRAADEESEHQNESAFDAHIWLDPANAEAIVRVVADRLAAIDSANAKLYRSNAETALAALERLDAELRVMLAPVRSAPIIVFHDAYLYFERAYELNVLAVVAINPEQRPGAKRIMEIQEIIAEHSEICVFAEPQFDPALLRTLVEGSAARTGHLDPLGASLDPGPESYANLMRAMADSLRDCVEAEG